VGVAVAVATTAVVVAVLAESLLVFFPYLQAPIQLQ
jgi:hypothetical protein